MKPAYPTPAKVMKYVQAARAVGVDVGGFRVGADGTIEILAKSALKAKLTPLEEWRLAHGKGEAQGAA